MATATATETREELDAAQAEIDRIAERERSRPKPPAAEAPDDQAAIDAANATGDRSIEDMARDEVEPEPEKPTPPMRVPIPGTIQKISAQFGGRQPDTSEIRLMGGKLPIQGSFNKGETVTLIVTAKVTGVLGQDVTDEWGTEESTVRRHMARMISVQRVVSQEGGGGFELADGQQEIASRP